MNDLKKGINPLKVKQLNHTLSWSIAGLIVCGGLTIMFALSKLIYPAVITTIGTLVSFYILWGETHKRVS
jgi:hypothetical protein